MIDTITMHFYYLLYVPFTLVQWCHNQTYTCNMLETRVGNRRLVNAHLPVSKMETETHHFMEYGPETPWNLGICCYI